MFKEIMIIVFCPSRFAQIAADHAIKMELQNNDQFRKMFPDGKLPSNKQKEFEGREIKRTNLIRHSFAVGFLLALATFTGGWVSGTVLGCLVGRASKMIIIVLQSAGAFIILGATLSFVGSEIESWNLKTLPEKVNRWLYRILYIIGTWILIMSLTWS